MSSAIKSPGGGPGPTESLSGAEAAEQAGQMEGRSVVAGSEAGGTAKSGTEAWLERMDAGEVSAEQAVDGIVAEALEAHGGARLPEAQRNELQAVLKTALLEDPTLSALLAGVQS